MAGNIGGRQSGGGGTSSGGGLDRAAVDARVRALIASWARATGASGQAPEGIIPASIARDSEIPTVPDPALVADVDAVGSTGANLDAIQATARASLNNTKWLSVRTAARLLARVLKLATTTQRGVVLTARNTDVDSDGAGADQARVTTVGAAKRLIGRMLPTAGVVRASVNTIIPDGADGHTYVYTGSAAGVRFSLPSASGESAVADGWEVSIVNRGSEPLDLPPDGSDTINGRGLLSVPSGESVTVEKVAAGVWVLVADTGRGAGSAGPAGEIPDNSIASVKALASSAAQRLGWRTKIGAARITTGADLHALTEAGVGDLHLITQDGTTTVNFVDISAQSTATTDALAGDVIQVVMLRAKTWVRLGNVLAARAARTTADAANTKAGENEAAIAAANLDRGTVIEAGPAFVAGETGQRNLYVSIRHPLNAYADANIISVAVQGQTPNLQEYVPSSLQATYTVGITAAQRDNINNAKPNAGDFVTVEIRLTAGRNGPLHLFRHIEVPVVAKVPARFESVVGASPAVLPKGSVRVFGLMQRTGTTGKWPFQVELSEIPSAEENFLIGEHNPADVSPGHNQAVTFAASYNTGNRTLTYRPRGGNNNQVSISSIKVEGFA